MDSSIMSSCCTLGYGSWRTLSSSRSTNQASACSRFISGSPPASETRLDGRRYPCGAIVERSRPPDARFSAPGEPPGPGGMGPGQPSLLAGRRAPGRAGLAGRVAEVERVVEEVIVLLEEQVAVLAVRVVARALQGLEEGRNARADHRPGGGGRPRVRDDRVGRAAEQHARGVARGGVDPLRQAARDRREAADR